MTATHGAARQFLADNGFYQAGGEDDGSSETLALQGAEASLAEIMPALAILFDDEIKALVILLEVTPSNVFDAMHINAIVMSSDRIIDVADTLGYALEASLACDVRNICKAIEDGGKVAPDIFARLRHALQESLRRRRIATSSVEAYASTGASGRGSANDVA